MNSPAPSVILLSALGLWTSVAGAQSSDPAEFFETRVRPLLAQNCYACHTHARMGGLQLDSRESMLKGGNSGPAIIPGKPEDSLLIQAVRRSHERFKMPPSTRLTAQQVADLAAWIKSGALWPENKVTTRPVGAGYVITPEQRAFWAFQPVRKPRLPEVKKASWLRSPIDRFILAALERQGLQPVRPASKRVLIRRATLDLIGLPPTPEEVNAFLHDNSPDAFAKVVDRLLASPHYGERWGRYWLDLARYADGKLGAIKDDPYPNAFRYRDWVIQALNEDMPYDLFVKAQLAADQLASPSRERLLAGLGFLALGPSEVAGVPVDDRVEVTSRVFLALTANCAQCHDHKFDPIPTQDYYSLLGVFKSSEDVEIPLAPEAQVEALKQVKKQINRLPAEMDEFIERQSNSLIDIFMDCSGRYLAASWEVLTYHERDAAAAAASARLDRETLERWVHYLEDPNKEHPFLKPFYQAMARGASLTEIRAIADDFQKTVLAVHSEKKAVDDRNYVKLGGANGLKDSKTRQFTNLEFLPADKGYLWRDLASPPFTTVGDSYHFAGGIYYYGKSAHSDSDNLSGEPIHASTDAPIGRFLDGVWKEHLNEMGARLEELKKSLPPPYPFLHAVRDSAHPANLRVAIRGEANNPGEEAPRRFLRILSTDEPTLFTHGSGRLELAEAIASPTNPLTARVIVNRVWALHFGEGIVRTLGNFGQTGERPANPELLDYLAAWFVENGWSIKKLHRLIMSSSTYSMSTEHSATNFEKDPENRLHWRANVNDRLDAEALRDSILAVAGTLDRTIGGPPAPFTDKNCRRTVYATVSRTKPDQSLALFDFPDPNITSDQRLTTVGPLQRLFFMNSDFVLRQSKALAARLAQAASDDTGRIRYAYELLYSRPPEDAEIRAGLEFLKESNGAWAQYAQVLLGASEFTSVN